VIDTINDARGDAPVSNGSHHVLSYAEYHEGVGSREQIRILSQIAYAFGQPRVSERKGLVPAEGVRSIRARP
jgi:hypothetical protein